MTSPPRRMTRARAKKEGYEPDWRINPHWKTPKKPKAKTKRCPFQDNNNLENNGVHQSNVTEGAQRVPSPIKIRIAAKPPPISQIEKPTMQPLTAFESHETSSAAESPRKSVNLGSPVRVRPRTEMNYNIAADKENSSSAAMLAAWTMSGKSIVPTTPAPAPRLRPLEASPSNINTHPQPTTVKVLSTPIRILKPETPGRILGSARRIPVKAEKTKTAIYKLNPASPEPFNPLREFPRDRFAREFKAGTDWPVCAADFELTPEFRSDLKIRLKVRRAALASSPSFGLLSHRRHFFSTSTYSASITPSSFFA